MFNRGTKNFVLKSFPESYRYMCQHRDWHHGNSFERNLFQDSVDTRMKPVKLSTTRRFQQLNLVWVGPRQVRLWFIFRETGWVELLNPSVAGLTRHGRHNFPDTAALDVGFFKLKSVCLRLLVMKSDNDDLLSPFFIIFHSSLSDTFLIFVLVVLLLCLHNSWGTVLLLLQGLQWIYQTIQESEESI